MLSPPVLETEYLRANNLLKVITRRKSGAAGIWTCDTETDTLTTQPPRLTIM